MSGSKLYDEAGRAMAEQGMVLFDGPNGIAITWTPDAARQTAEQLLAAAMQAQAQDRHSRN